MTTAARVTPHRVLPAGSPATAFLLVLLALPDATGCGGEARPGAGRGTLAAQPQQRTMEKWVSPGATVVLYRPAGWTVEETDVGTAHQVTVRDGTRSLEATMAYGPVPAGADVVAVARAFLEPLDRGAHDLTVTQALQAADGSRLVVDGTFTEPACGAEAFRLWVVFHGDGMTVTRIAAPPDQLEQEKPRLLSILANVRVLAGSVSDAVTAPLVAHRLRDGSASFQMPRGWQVQELGAGGFVAADPAGSPSFIVANAEVVYPELGVRPPGVPVAPYQPPHQALAFLATSARLVSNVQFLWVNPRPEVDALIRHAYTGPVTTEEFVYTFADPQGRAGKAYSFGITFGSQLPTTWRLWHLTVGAPAERFDALVPTFITMLQSYQIDQGYAREYVRRGMENLRRLQRETAQLAARNAEEIRATMQAAYDERQTSQDYIDYQRTSYIRGQQDWISEMEGGALYRADAWGTKNTVTGESWEGAPYDYVHFTGANPKYREQMTPVNSRRLWERYAR